MADIASLGIVVKTQGVQQSTAELKALEKAGDASAVAATRAGKAWGTALGLAASAFVVGGITAIIKATIESTKVQAQLEARVKALGSSSAASAKQIDTLATALQNVSTFDDESIKRAATALLAFTNLKPGNFNRAMKDIADLAAATGDDIVAVTDKVGKALNNPLTASRSLREVGIELTKSQKDLLKSLLDSGDAAGAQAIILQELEHRYAGAAAAARDTLGGALKGLKNDFENLLEGDGKGVKGTTEAINQFGETLRSEGVRSGFATVVNGLFSLAGAAAKTVAAFSVSAQRIGILVAEIANQAQALATITKNVQTFGLASGTISDSVAQMRRGFAQFKSEDAALVASFHAVGKSAKEAGVNVSGYTKEVRGTGIFANVNTAAPDKPDTPKPARTRSVGGGGGSSVSRASLDLTKGAADDLKQLAEREAQATESFKDMAATLAGPLAQAEREHQKNVEQLNALAKESPVAQAGLNDALKLEAERYAKTTKEIQRQLNPFQQLLQEKENDLRLMGLQGVARDIEIDQQRLGRQLTEEETAALREKNQALEDGAKAAELQQKFQGALADSITDFVTGAKSAKDAAKSFFDTMAKYITQMIAEQWAKKIGDTMSGSSANGGQGGGTNWFGMIASLFGGGSANGNAFAGGNVQAFASGGVVDRTTAFGMSGGRFGIMGEAGPEAILPLHRGPDGKLGVRMEAANDSHSRPVVNNVTTFVLPHTMRPETQAQIAQNQQRAANRATARNR